MTDLKTCTKCKQKLARTKFYDRDSQKKDGYYSSCKKCHGQYMRNRSKEYQSRKHIKSPKKKYCPLCKAIRSSKEFTSNRCTKDGLNGYCRPCATRKRFEHRSKSMRGYLKNKYEKIPCSDCRQIFPWECMDFDHNEGAKKRFNVCSYKANNLQTPERIATIEEEIKNCTIVCSNCHRIRTVTRAKAKRENYND